MLLEKAVAKLHGSYDKMCDGAADGTTKRETAFGPRNLLRYMLNACTDEYCLSNVRRRRRLCGSDCARGGRSAPAALCVRTLASLCPAAPPPPPRNNVVII